MKPVVLALLVMLCGGQTTAPSTAPATKPATTAAAVDYYALAAEDFSNLPIVRTRITIDSEYLLLPEAAIYHQTNLE